VETGKLTKSAPSLEPISLETARLHLKLDAIGSPLTHPDDPLVLGVISAARESAEFYTGLAIAAATYEVAYDAFPSVIDLQVWPVQSINSVTYIDDDGDTMILDDSAYFLDARSKPAKLHVVDRWPPTKAIVNAVVVSFEAGNTDDLSPNTYPLPLSLKQAMLLMIGRAYVNRDDSKSITDNQALQRPPAAEYLMQGHRIGMGM